MSFKNLNLINPIIRAISEKGYSKPTDIQYSAIPPILSGKDVIGYATSGEGKTAAFILPILQLQKRYTPEHREIRILILTPNKELVIELEEKVIAYSKYLPLSQLSIYEGMSMGSQLAALKTRVDMLIATPERLLELIMQRHIDFSKIEILVLDGADKVKDAGFINNVMQILKHIPIKRQTLFFSALISQQMQRFAKTILNNPVDVMAQMETNEEASLEKEWVRDRI